MHPRHQLIYNSDKWAEIFPSPVNTLQLFITNRCNLRCKGCFMSHKLGGDEMSFEEYTSYLENYIDKIGKVTLLGGEPTFHKDLGRMIEFNQSLGLKTTVYTNGANLGVFESMNLSDISIRIGVHGTYSSEKPLEKVERTFVPVDIVYMMTKANVSELFPAAQMAENDFNCKGFYISSIRDIAVTGDFWKDTPETISPLEYARVIQNFFDNYSGKIPKIHIARRGVIYTGNEKEKVDCCRFGNIFTNGEKIICSLDISLKKTTDRLRFNERKCNKNDSCVLTKVVLQNKRV